MSSLTPFYQKLLITGTLKQIVITKTRLFNYIENFTTKKWELSDEKFW